MVSVDQGKSIGDDSADAIVECDRSAEYRNYS